MKQLFITSCLLLACHLGSGCVAMGKYNGGRYYPFKACSYDVLFIGESVYYPIAGWPEGGPRHVLDPLLSPPFIPFWLLDLVFSFVSDVVTFPYDLYHVGEKIETGTDDVKKPADGQEEKPDASPNGTGQKEHEGEPRK